MIARNGGRGLETTLAMLASIVVGKGFFWSMPQTVRSVRFVKNAGGTKKPINTLSN